MIRLRTLIARHYNLSNRKADELIHSGRVLVNGEKQSPVRMTGEMEEVTLDGAIIRSKKEFSYVMFYKPRGIECTLNEELEYNLKTVFKHESRLYPVGRLDKESEGLLLMTDDGDLYNNVARSEKGKEKEYVVTVHKEIDDDFIFAMSNGIEILGKKTREAKVWRVKDDAFSFHIILTQGMNRQIRRMCYKLGYGVRNLVRVRIADLKLDVKAGEWRELLPSEINSLKGL
ncbi:MAG TPA: pseudouridine synthase [Bacteroidia bacterium]|nr:pseudouridine synthase [Bacteroidia bacterium]